MRAVRRRHPGNQCALGRHRHRRTRRGSREAELHVRAVRAGRAGAIPRGEACIRSARVAESGQGDPDAASLCGVRQDARAPRHAAVSRLAEVLMDSREPALARLIDRVAAARAGHAALDIRGGGTKVFYGEPPRGEPLDVPPLAGISCYEPTELVVTVRAGTPLCELEAALEAQGQCLPFEPPRFSPGGTVGGMVASGLSGPARASVGTVRDHVLGVTLLNGRGEVLTFGGQVAKNVAGYDVSRLIVGSLGILGIICEVSLKVLPMNRATATLCFDCNESRALEQV